MLRQEELSGAPGLRYGGDSEPGPADAVLMFAMRTDDPKGLEALMERHWVPLVRFAARALSGWDEAEDVAQGVFVRVWRSRASWQPEGSVRAYLYRIARNLIVDARRHQRVREQGREALQASRRPPTPSEETIRGEFQADLDRALSELAPRRRQAFVLVRLQGLSLKEAADVMGLTPRTVANHVYLAATDLAEALRAHLT